MSKGSIFPQEQATTELQNPGDLIRGMSKSIPPVAHPSVVATQPLDDDQATAPNWLRNPVPTSFAHASPKQQEPVWESMGHDGTEPAPFTLGGNPEKKAMELREQKIALLQQKLDQQAATLSQQQQQLEVDRGTVRQAMEETASLRGQVLIHAEQELLRLVTRVANTVVHGELAVQPELHRELVQQALDAAANPEQVRVRITPKTQQALGSKQATPWVVGNTKIAVQVDPALEGVGCIVEEGGSRIDGTVAGRLLQAQRQFEQALQDRVSSSQPGGSPRQAGAMESSPSEEES